MRHQDDMNIRALVLTGAVPSANGLLLTQGPLGFGEAAGFVKSAALLSTAGATGKPAISALTHRG